MKANESLLILILTRILSIIIDTQYGHQKGKGPYFLTSTHRGAKYQIVFRGETPLVASVSALTPDTLRGPDHTQVMTPSFLPVFFFSHSAEIRTHTLPALNL